MPGRLSARQKLTCTFASGTLHSLQHVYRDWNERVREFLRAGGRPTLAITGERSPSRQTEYPAQMDDDLRALGEDLITTAARVVRWVPKENGFTISLAAARLLARLQDDGPTRISELAVAEKCSQPTITNHVKRLEAAHLVDRTADPRDARAWMIKLTKKGNQQLSVMRASIGTSLEPYLATMSKRDLKALRDGIEAMQRLMAVERETQHS
jgi:DNA-binding MarR family transcriptional regulator